MSNDDFVSFRQFMSKFQGLGTIEDDAGLGSPMGDFALALFKGNNSGYPSNETYQSLKFYFEKKATRDTRVSIIKLFETAWAFYCEFKP